jgi:hypothetical protein
MVEERGVAVNGGGCGKDRGLLREENKFPAPHPQAKKIDFCRSTIFGNVMIVGSRRQR